MHILALWELKCSRAPVFNDSLRISRYYSVKYRVVLHNFNGPQVYLEERKLKTTKENMFITEEGTRGKKTLDFENCQELKLLVTSLEMTDSFEPARASYMCTNEEFRSLMASLALTSPCL